MSRRGLNIQDHDLALRYLSTVSYYRLSAYFKPFLIFEDCDHQFRADITFDQIWQAYVFDRELRLYLSDALERIEITLRTALSDVMSIKYGNLWYISEKPFYEKGLSSNNKRKISPHNSFIKEVDDVCKDQKEKFIAHYFERYSDPIYPPSWMMMKCLSFGKITSLFRNLARLQDKKLICDVFGYHPRVNRINFRTFTIYTQSMRASFTHME